MGRVAGAPGAQTGSRAQPLLSRKAAPGSGPTCSRGDGCEPRMATRERKAIARAMRYFSVPSFSKPGIGKPGGVVMGTAHCKGIRAFGLRGAGGVVKSHVTG